MLSRDIFLHVPAECDVRHCELAVKFRATSPQRILENAERSIIQNVWWHNLFSARNSDTGLAIEFCAHSEFSRNSADSRRGAP